MSFVYHLGEGIYGLFNSVLFVNACPTPTLQPENPLQGPQAPCLLQGVCKRHSQSLGCLL